MLKNTARRHKTAVRHAPAARSRRQEKATRGPKPAPEKTRNLAIGVAEFKPTVIDVVELDFANDLDEVLADDPLVTGFEDEGL